MRPSSVVPFSPRGIGAVGTQLGTVTNMDLGTDADKPAAGQAGRVWFSVDLGVIYFDSGTAWIPVAVDSMAGLIDTQVGLEAGLAIDAAAVVQKAVVLATPYPTSLDRVFLTLREPTEQDARFGGVWTTAETQAGFTINVAVATASGTAGATVNVGWQAVGH